MEKTPWQKYKESLGDSRPWDVLKPSTEFVSEEISSSRYNICKQCPELINLTKQCKQCGCFMAVKSKLSNASCPLGKW